MSYYCFLILLLNIGHLSSVRERRRMAQNATERTAFALDFPFNRSYSFSSYTFSPRSGCNESLAAVNITGIGRSTINNFLSFDVYRLFVDQSYCWRMTRWECRPQWISIVLFDLIPPPTRTTANTITSGPNSRSRIICNNASLRHV